MKEASENNGFAAPAFQQMCIFWLVFTLPYVQTQHPEPCSICSESTTACEHTETVRAMQKLRHRCATCARSFESAAALHVHERVHTGEKPEICEICGRSFQHKSNLQKHMMKHSGHRPHACPSCPRAFYARHSLMAHMRKHTGDSPYHCETCGKSFCTKNSLQVCMVSWVFSQLGPKLAVTPKKLDSHRNYYHYHNLDTDPTLNPWERVCLGSWGRVDCSHTAYFIKPYLLTY